MSSIKKWDNGVYKWDVTEASRALNPWLKNFGRDRYTYSEEIRGTTTRHFYNNEAKICHGYPKTAWLQLALIYAAGLYTAKEQGIVKKGVYFQRYWRAHYFDWLLFLRRGSIYGMGGGLFIGILTFGYPITSIRRVVSKYNRYFVMRKPDQFNKETSYFINH